MEDNYFDVGSRVCAGDKYVFNVSYILFSEENEEGDTGWGIRLIKYTDGSPVEKAEVKNITPDFNKALSIANNMKENSVTPISLKDTLINIVG